MIYIKPASRYVDMSIFGIVSVSFYEPYFSPRSTTPGVYHWLSDEDGKNLLD